MNYEDLNELQPSPLEVEIAETINRLDDEKLLSQQDRFIMTEAFNDYIILATQKYLKGVKEHGGSLFGSGRDALHEAKLEHIDTFFYHFELQRQINALKSQLNQQQKGQ